MDNRIPNKIIFSKNMKSLNKLFTGDAEGWSMIDVQLDKVLQVDISHIFSSFSKSAEFDLIEHFF